MNDGIRDCTIVWNVGRSRYLLALIDDDAGSAEVWGEGKGLY